MIVTNDQIRQIQAERENQFCETVCSELRIEIPEQMAAFSEESLLAIVKASLRNAQSYGLATGDSVRRFIKLAVLVHPQFDKHPDVQRFMRMPDLDPDMKIKLLSQLVAKRIQDEG